MQGSSYAPLQFLRSPWNRDVYTAIDNQVDGRTVLVLYLGAASTLPSELQKYNIGCILIHKDEKQIYLNTGNETTPTWQSFGPGTNTLPTPFVAGQYLTNDGVDAFWSLIDLATGVDGLLDSDHIDLSDLANNSDFIDYLIGNSYFTSSLANDSNFLTNLITNLNSAGTLAVVTDGVTITGDGTSGNPLTATGGSDNYTVKATATDTTPSYLDDKINIHSSDSSVSVTKTITNPAGNEVVDYDLSATGSVSIQNVNIFDDFVSKIEASGSTAKILSTYNWRPLSNVSTLGAFQSASDSASYGVVTVQNDNFNGDGFSIGDFISGSSDPSNITYGTFDVEFRVYIETAQIAEGFFFGLASGTMGSSFTTTSPKRIGIFSDNTGWKGIACDAVTAPVTSATAITGNAWVKLRITYDGTQAEFFVNGVSIGTITLSVTGNCAVTMQTKKNTIASSFNIDYMKLNYQVTR